MDTGNGEHTDGTHGACNNDTAFESDNHVSNGTEEKNDKTNNNENTEHAGH